MSEKENKSELTYLELISIFLEKKKKIFLVSAIVGIIAIVIAFFVLDPIFLSSATIKTISKSSGISSLISSEGLPDIGDLSNLGGGSAVKELALYENILTSRRCVEEAIVKFNIMEEEHFTYVFDAVKYFRGNVMMITKDKVAGTMEIGAFDKDPVKAKEMVDFLVFQLNKINTELNILNAKNNREFIEGRYDLVKLDLQKMEDTLKQFQDIYGIAPDLQVQAAVKAEIEIESEIKSEQVKLEILRKILSPDQEEVKIMEEKIIALQKQLSDVRNNTDLNDVLTLKGKPGIVLNYFRLRREVEIQNKILTTLIPLLEQSKIEEKRETPSVLLLDPPVVPDKKFKPKRLPIVIISIALTFCFAFLYFIAKSKWNSVVGNISSIRSQIRKN
ncbi:MAG: Wzz/FepE/Etk N-terminal domain-containing protein [Bacteroidota bacterium]|nr:Wzz/FepE/Etk N-terminal domain-containing protein [Bacteroidota bacterium]